MCALQSELSWAPAVRLALALLLLAAPACLAARLSARDAARTMCNDPLCGYECTPGGPVYPCSYCVPHYRLVDGVCRRCRDPACSLCDASNKCFDCIQGAIFASSYSRVNGVCKAPLCGYGCFKCAMSTEGGKPRCLRCVAGLTLVGGRCQLVKNYHAYCLYDDKRCVGCRQPYGFINGTCVPSGIPNCRAVTTVNNQAKCLGCSPGYGLDKRSVKGRCVRCAAAHCYSCSTEYTLCEQCAEGYALEFDQCVPNKCPSPCLTCAKSSLPNPTPCLDCKDGYAGVGIPFTFFKKCVPCVDPNCVDCSTSPKACIACKTGFAIVGGKCTKVPQCRVDRCKTCRSNRSICAVCSPGWGRDAKGQCTVKCARSTGEPNCQDCSTSRTICEACRPGYILSFDTQGRLRCLACGVKNCEICAHPTKCEVCAERFTLRPNSTCAPA